MFSISIVARLGLGLGAIASAACAGTHRKPDAAEAPQSFYTVMAEIALARHEPRVAALQYAAAARADASLLQRAAEVAAETLQPDVELGLAERWIRILPDSLDARRAAAMAALSLDRIGVAAADYLFVLARAPGGADTEFDALSTQLQGTDNIYGARRLADRLAIAYPASRSALRVQGMAALRADDPAAAARSLTAALTHPAPGGAGVAAPDGTAESGVPAADAGGGSDAELTQSLLRARVLAGDVDAPLADSVARLDQEDTIGNRFDYALLLVAAKRIALARVQLNELLLRTESRPGALRVLGLLELQEGNDEAAGVRFTDLLASGRFADDAFYYLGLIADRHDDLERALRCYARVQAGDNVVPALLRAAAILHMHGGAPESEQILERLLEDEPGRAPDILAARAQMVVDGGEAQRGLALFDRAVQEYPENVALRFARASGYEQQGMVDAALDELSAIARERPDDPAAWNALGYTLADHSRQLVRARAMIERAYAAAPGSAAIRDSLGWVLFRQGRPAEALPYLAAAYADEPGGDIAAHWGEVLWRLGRQADADRVWSQASTIDSDNHLLKATRQRLHAGAPAGN